MYTYIHTYIICIYIYIHPVFRHTCIKMEIFHAYLGFNVVVNHLSGMHTQVYPSTHTFRFCPRHQRWMLSVVGKSGISDTHTIPMGRVETGSSTLVFLWTSQYIQYTYIYTYIWLNELIMVNDALMNCSILDTLQDIAFSWLGQYVPVKIVKD